MREKVSRFMLFSDDYVIVDGRRFTVQTMVTDSLYLGMMPHPVITGKHTLSTPNDAIITRKLAKRLFKNENPIGKTLKVSTGDIVTITGMIDEAFNKSIPYNLRSSFPKACATTGAVWRMSWYNYIGQKTSQSLIRKIRNLWS